MLRKIRIVLGAVMFIGITLLFLDFTGTLHHWVGWMPKIQLLEAVLAVNVIVVAALVLLTLVLGRIYCSVICPLGILQDVFGWLGKKQKKNRYSYSKEVKWLRYPVLVAFVVALLAGVGTVVQLLAPYSAFGRIATTLLQPVWKACNNLLAAVAEHVDSYAFYHVDAIVPHIGLVTAIAAVTLVILFVLAWRNGRTYCNTICPVGTVLSLLSRWSWLKIRFDADKCKSCSLCSKNCKASCIDFKTHSVDYSRCVVCGDCIDSCKHGALAYQAHKPHDAEGLSRRSFLLSAALATTAALAQEAKKTDGGLADITKKQKPHRDKLITPPGSLSIRNLRTHCTACHLCIDACPNDVLRPSSSLDRFMQPEVSFERGYCRPECTRCSEVCPTSAIQPVTVEQRTAIQVGHAVWTRDLCVPVKDEKPCGLCARKCPAEAIQMVPLHAGVHQDGWRWRDADGQEIPRDKVLLIPVINEEKCIGCGACENLCPSSPISAIYVEGHEVHKEI